MAKHSFFVTGTDTGVGKTLVSAAILHAARTMGKHTLAMKPIASGCDRTPEGLRNEDALILQNAITEPLAYELINRWRWNRRLPPTLPPSRPDGI